MRVKHSHGVHSSMKYLPMYKGETMNRLIYYIIKNEMDKEDMRNKIETTEGMMIFIIIVMAVIFLFMLFSSN